MTEQQFVEEFRSYPKTQQFEIICELANLYEADLEEHIRNGGRLSAEEEKTVNHLREVVAAGLKTE